MISVSKKRGVLLLARTAHAAPAIMISIELWRAKIGVFNCSRHCRPSSICSNLQQQTTHGLFSSSTAGGGGLFCRSLLIRRALALLLVAVITHLLLSAGDVERNPGPISKGILSKLFPTTFFRHIICR